MTALSRLASGHYNNLPYDPALNPGGLPNGGHQQNFPAALQDLGSVMSDLATQLLGLAESGVRPEFRLSGAWVQWRLQGQGGAWQNLVQTSLFSGIEMGTWTPTISGLTSAGAPTYTTQNGRYIKIGKLVFVTLHLVVSGKVGLTGQVQIKGIPFAANGTPAARAILTPSFNSGIQLPTGGTSWFGFLYPDGYRLHYRTQTAGSAGVTDAMLSAATTIYATSTYEAA